MESVAERKLLLALEKMSPYRKSSVKLLEPAPVHTSSAVPSDAAALTGGREQELLKQESTEACDRSVPEPLEKPAQHAPLPSATVLSTNDIIFSGHCPAAARP